MTSIETRGLNYSYGRNIRTLENVSIQVPAGSIYGFLGPNGAGKTTTLKLILGLLRKQEGEIDVLNLPIGENRIGILRRTGTLIESPSLYSHLTATENLLIYQKIYRCPKSRIEEVLAQVGLPSTGKKRAGKFSLGMKQRLGIAIALLHDPELLILDEPTNGLDPNGIIELRELLAKLSTVQKKTIVISSHLLPEVEKIATYVGIINKGKMLFQGTLQDLQLKQSHTSITTIHTNSVTRASEIVRYYNIPYSATGEHINIATSDREILASINQQLVSNDIKVYQIETGKNNLESIFINLVNN
jgi:ABC-type multidrug transport system ATPase subunit